MTTSQTRLIAGFKLLGMRLSADDLSFASTGFNDTMNEETMNIAKAFMRALKEENLVNQWKVQSFYESFERRKLG